MAERDKPPRARSAGKSTANGRISKSHPIGLNKSGADAKETDVGNGSEGLEFAATGERDNDNNDDDAGHGEMSTPFIINEDLWIKLYHHLLIVAAQLPSEPVVWLYNTNQLQYLDAYLKGKITTDSMDIEGPWPVRRDSVGKDRFVKACENLVEGLRVRIKAISAENWQEEGAKESQNISVPERLWKFIITPAMISKYSEVLQAIGVRGELVNPEAHPELLTFLELILTAQYNTTTWVHTSSSRKTVPKQKPIDRDESFTPSEGRMVTFYETVVPGTNLTYRQQDTIPEILSTPIDTTNLPKNYILPPIELVRLPTRSRKGHLWKYRESSGSWERGDGKIWRFCGILRLFRSATNEYLRATTNVGLFEVCDPNSQEFLRVYNRWVNQWHRRQTGQVSVVKLMWKSTELDVLFSEINKLLNRKGIMKYKEIHTAEFNDMVTGKINDTANGSRKSESVASMLRRASGPVYDLIERAKDITKRVGDGERLSRKELFPKEAIAMDQATMEKEEEEGEDGCDASTTEHQHMEEAIHTSKQDTWKRKRGEEEDEWLEEVSEDGLEKKRPRKMNEEDTAEDMAENIQLSLFDERIGDGGLQASLDMRKSIN